MPTSAESFKLMYKEFINELMKEFPDIIEIKDEKLNSFKFKGDHMKRFIKRIQTPEDFSKMITERNEALFASECKLIKDIGLHLVWKVADENTKNSIWQHLNTMYVLSSTISSIPPKMLSNIETMAQQFAQQMSQSDMQNLDMGAIMQGLQNMTGNNFKK